MLAHTVICQSNMASKMAAAENSKLSKVRNYELKFDDTGVYPYVFAGKECIKAMKIMLAYYLTCQSNMVESNCGIFFVC